MPLPHYYADYIITLFSPLAFITPYAIIDALLRHYAITLILSFTFAILITLILIIADDIILMLIFSLLFIDAITYAIIFALLYATL
jgi:hypothetical protein